MKRDTVPNGGKIEKRVLIKASTTVIYQALTCAKDLVHWFCDRATCEPHEGGELAAYWKTGKAGKNGRAVFTRAEAPSQVELVWVDDGNGPASEENRHVLSYSIRSRGEDSEVLMRDEGWPPPDEETFAVLNSGWNSVLMELKDYCERRERSPKLQPSGEST